MLFSALYSAVVPDVNVKVNKVRLLFVPPREHEETVWGGGGGRRLRSARPRSQKARLSEKRHNNHEAGDEPPRVHGVHHSSMTSRSSAPLLPPRGRAHLALCFRSMSTTPLVPSNLPYVIFMVRYEDLMGSAADVNVASHRETT